VLFRRLFALPSSVWGPVLLWAFSRLVKICFTDAMDTPTWFEDWIIASVEGGLFTAVRQMCCTDGGTCYVYWRFPFFETRLDLGIPKASSSRKIASFLSRKRASRAASISRLC
jgi:hypothetical protein